MADDDLLPILNFPSLVLEKILGKLNASDTIDFSLCSEKCKEIVKATRHPYTSMDINVGPQRSLALKIGDTECFKWIIDWNEAGHYDVFDYYKMVWKKIDGVDMKVLKSIDKDGFKSINASDHHIKIVYNYVQELFNLPISYYRFTTCLSQEMLPRFFGVKKCEKLDISARKKVSNDDLRYVIKDMEVSKQLRIRELWENKTFRCKDARFSQDEIDFTQAGWVTRGTFLSLNCARIRLYQAKLKVKDYQDFVWQWLDSTSNRLEYVSSTGTGIPDEIDVSMFQPQEWDPNIRGRYYVLSESYCPLVMYDCSNSMDIIRSDGLLATFYHLHGRFQFFVWHNRFPDLTNVRGHAS